MKIFSLPKGSQHGLKGQVVLVPSNIEQTANSLPRETHDAQLVALNLKRRMSDKNAYCKEFIRPQLVNDALRHLISVNTHYSNINYKNKWTENSEQHDEVLWKAVHSDNQHEEPESEDDSSDKEHSDTEIIYSDQEIEKDLPQSVVEDLSTNRSLNSSTCLYPDQGPIVRSNRVLNLAPAEGQIPTSVFFLQFWETLAFPTLFPTGRNTFHEERVVPITPKKYVNARLLSKDFRFADSVEYTFQCLHWIESVTVNDNINFSLKKKQANRLIRRMSTRS